MGDEILTVETDRAQIGDIIRSSCFAVGNYNNQSEVIPYLIDLAQYDKNIEEALFRVDDAKDQAGWYVEVTRLTENREEYEPPMKIGFYQSGDHKHTISKVELVERKGDDIGETVKNLLKVRHNFQHQDHEVINPGS